MNTGSRELARLGKMADSIDKMADSLISSEGLESLAASELSRLQQAKYDLWNAANTLRSIKGGKP